MRAMTVDSPKLFKGLMLFGFTGFLMRLQLSGHINLLVSPVIASIIRLSMILLLILLIPIVISSFSVKKQFPSLKTQEIHNHVHDEHCDCAHDHASSQLSGSSKFSLSLFFASLLIGFSWQPVALGSNMIQKGASGAATAAQTSSSATDTSSVNPPAVNANVGVVDQQEGTDSQASIAMRYSAEPNQYLGKQVTMDGFVFHPAGMPDNLFILTRYFVFCCIADATPIGIAVQTPDAQTLKNDTWVTVSGVIKSGDLQVLNQYAPTAWYQGQKSSQFGLPEIGASSVKVIPIPAAPYMFPR